MIGLLGRLRAAATLGQHCPQMTQRPGMQLGLLYGAELNPCNLPHNVTFWSSVDIINGSIPYVYATIFYLLGTQG